MRDDLPWFGFGGEDAGRGLFIDFFLGSLGEAAGKLLITDGTGGSQDGQKRVDLPRGQRVDDLVKPVQVTPGSLDCRRGATPSMYRETRGEIAPFGLTGLPPLSPAARSAGAGTCPAIALTGSQPSAIMNLGVGVRRNRPSGKMTPTERTSRL